jgi:two-component system, LytTR family, response regulator
MTNVLIVDDEQFSVDAIKSYADKIPFLNVVLATTSAIEASIAVQNQDIDLVFSDVCMPELNGIELVKLIQGKSKVIFITATPDYALQGYQNDVIDYLMKPLFFETFFKAAQKAEKLIMLEKNHTKKTIESAKKSIFDDFMMVKTERKGKLIKVKFNDIVCIEGDGNYVKIWLSKEDKIMALLTFKSLEEILPREQFIRVNKSYIVALQLITGIEGNIVQLGDLTVPIGGTYKDNVTKLFVEKVA